MPCCMNVMAAICNSFSGRRSFASLTRSPGLDERAPVEEAAGNPSPSKTKLQEYNSSDNQWCRREIRKLEAAYGRAETSTTPCLKITRVKELPKGDFVVIRDSMQDVIILQTKLK